MDDSMSYVAREMQHYDEKQLLLTRIYQLEEKYERAMENAKILSDAVTKLERERDFLIKYLTDSTFAPCDICKHGAEGASVMDCEQIRKVGIPCFEWRGLPEV